MLKTQVIQRKDAYKLLDKIRNILNENDLSEYLGDYAGEGQTELEVALTGVSNGFLSEVIYAVTGYKAEVCGKVELLFPCPCCGYRTLTERYDPMKGDGYDICPYCNWEDDGTKDIDSHSSVNKGSIRDYREKLHANPNKYYQDKWLKK